MPSKFMRGYRLVWHHVRCAKKEKSYQMLSLLTLFFTSPRIIQKQQQKKFEWTTHTQDSRIVHHAAPRSVPCTAVEYSSIWYSWLQYMYTIPHHTQQTKRTWFDLVTSKTSSVQESHSLNKAPKQ